MQELGRLPYNCQKFHSIYSRYCIDRAEERQPPTAVKSNTYLKALIRRWKYKPEKDGNTQLGIPLGYDQLPEATAFRLKEKAQPSQ